MKKTFMYFLFILILLRIFVELNSNYKAGSIIPSFSANKDWIKSTNVDDKELVNLAELYIRNNSFYTNVSFDRPKFRKDSIWKTAFRNNFYVYYFSILIKIKSNNEFKINKNEILEYHAKTMFIFKYFLLLISVCFLFFVIQHLLGNNYAYIGSILYLIYPSTFYVFYFNTFDSLCYPLLLITITLIFYSSYLFKSSYLKNLSISFFIIFSCLAKFHLLIIVFLTSLLFLIYSIYNKNIINVKNSILSILLSVSIIISYGFYNLYTYDHFIISTQSNINFFHGHNPVAKGSWNGNIWSDYSETLNPILLKNKESLSKNEYEECLVYKKIAVSWIKQNPVLELKLILKKIAIFFFPHNFLSWNFNIISFIFHCSFFIFLFLYGYIKKEYKIVIFIFSPIFICLFLNVYFFVEYRWRFYTDSFFIISLLYCINYFWDNVNKNKLT